ncbi:MAG: hypothetical protein ACRCV9_03500 [Burkholderiaceae bacterium]
MNEPLILLHAGICLGGICICICRARLMSNSTTKPVIRFQYVMWATTLTGLMFAAPGLPTTGSAACLVAALYAGLGAWKEGLPNYAKRRQFSDTLDVTKLWSKR